jgi:spore coat polysaccharide biosynthesis protein SpsF
MESRGSQERRVKALIRCAVSDPRLSAMLALGRALRDSENMGVAFALLAEKELSSIHRAGFAGRVCSPGEFPELVQARKPDLLILDGAAPTRGEAEALRRYCVLMAAIEDGSDSRLAYDFAYYPPLPRFLALDWTGARTVPRIGWDYVLPGLRPAGATARPPGTRLTLLVTMGDDPLDLTARVAGLLAPLDSMFRVRFAIGPSIRDGGKLAAGLVAMKSNYETVEGGEDFSTEYASADLALCSFGQAAYDLAAFGVPALYLSRDEDDVDSASAFAAAGMGVSLGMAADDADILAAVKALLNDSGRRRDMRVRALAAMDGEGAARIAADLAAALREEKPQLRLAR